MRVLILFFLGLPAFASDADIEAAAHRHFDKMPLVERIDDISGMCGASGQANRDAVYCTSKNTIYLRNGSSDRAYNVAHLYGHAVQVNHGIADIALREVRARPDEESKLRGMVTRQVECIAGFLHARAGVDVVFPSGSEPMTGSHWGRNPLKIGPKVTIGRDARQEWLKIGAQATDIAVCSVGEMSSDLLVKAFKE